jgi:hypothetical protein
MVKYSTPASNINEISYIAKGLIPYLNMRKSTSVSLELLKEASNNSRSDRFYMASSISGHTYNKANKEGASEKLVYGLEEQKIKQSKRICV